MDSDSFAAGVVSMAMPLEPVYDDPRLLTDQHERVAAWAAERIGCDHHAWAQYTTLGLERDGELVAGVVFEGYTGASANIHVAGTGKYWMNRAILFATFDYAFRQLKLKRLTGLVPAHNERALKFDLHLGFKMESIMVDALPEGDLVVLAMTPADCRFLEV